jgi:hypothetical protein
MNPKSEEFKATLSDIRARYATAKREATSQNMIGVGGCNYVCSVLDTIIKEANGYAERGDYSLTYAVINVVLQKCSWLCNYADSSSGCLTETIERASDVLQNICTLTPKDSADAKYIVQHGLKDVFHKDYDGWDEFPYGILRCVAKFANKTNEHKILEVLSQIDEKHKSEYSHLRQNTFHLLIKYEMTLALDGKQAAETFLQENINDDTLRMIAIDNAIKNKNLDRAEMFCRERIAAEKYSKSPYTRPSCWDYKLYEIISLSEDMDKQIEVARRILFLLDTDYYNTTKQLYIKRGSWEHEKPLLLKSLSKKLPDREYMTVLSMERETRLLLEKVKQNPQYSVKYGKQLAKEYPTQTYALIADEIRRQAAISNTRAHYRQVCSSIKKLFDFGGKKESFAIITELEEDYPRRPAFLEELGYAEARLMKKEK